MTGIEKEIMKWNPNNLISSFEYSRAHVVGREIFLLAHSSHWKSLGKLYFKKYNDIYIYIYIYIYITLKYSLFLFKCH